MNHGRVINGFLKRRKIYFPGISDTRPTTDMFKKTMFDVLLHNYIDSFSEYVAVDLFAGSGALGIECISLGCKQCYFVDNSYTAIDTIKTNIKNLGISEYSIVYRTEYRLFLDKFQKMRLSDKKIIIFLDPPYKSHYIEDVIKILYDIETSLKLLVIESKTAVQSYLSGANNIKARQISGRWLTIASL